MAFITYISSWGILYYILLNNLDKRYRLTKSKITVSVTFMTIMLLITFINLLSLPLLNLLVSLIIYIIMSTYLYEKHSLRQSLYDIMYFLMLVLINSFFYLLVHSTFRSTNQITNDILAAHITSIILLFLSNTLHIPMNKTECKIPLVVELVIYLMVPLFSITVIYILGNGYAIIQNQYILFISLGLICINIIIFYHLKYIVTNYKLRYQLEKERKHRELKDQYYVSLKQNFEDTQKLIHDSKNHLLAIKIAYQTKNMELAESITDTYYKEFDKSKTYYYSSSDILNIIVDEKNKQALSHKITFDFKSEEIDFSFINDFDMITIFGNLYDNAIEANIDLLDTNNKFIETTIFKVHDMVIIKIKNSCANTIKYHRNKIISTKNNHLGIGINNIKKTIHKYNGSFTIKNEAMKCVIMISIPSVK